MCDHLPNSRLHEELKGGHYKQGAGKWRLVPDLAENMCSLAGDGVRTEGKALSGLPQPLTAILRLAGP